MMVTIGDDDGIYCDDDRNGREDDDDGNFDRRPLEFPSGGVIR